MTDYYDHVLGLIPLALFGGSGLLSVAGLELTTAVSVAGAFAVALVAHALFVNGPVDSSPVTELAE